MSKRRHGIEALGLSLLAALGLMAFAASAQAGEYTLEGGSFTSKGLAQETVEGTVGAGKLLVPGFGITFACTGGTGSGTVLLGGVAHATVLFTGCTVEGNKFCKVFETKAKMEANLDPGFIAASGLGELVLMQTFGPVQHFLLLSSAEFATLYLTRSTSGCTLPLENKVSGSTVFFTGGVLSSSVSHSLFTLSQLELEALFNADKLLYGNQLSWLDGGLATVALSGVNRGKSWGAE